MNRQTAIILTVITALCCGCPGLISLCMGGMFALVGGIPGSDIDIAGSSDPMAAIVTGLTMLCGGVIMIAIPIVVGFLTLRKKPSQVVAEPFPGEPLPPSS